MTTNAPSFWDRMSLVRNAQRVRFPLLFEAADDEFRAAVESVTALREAGKPADLFVFPGEYHIKWQPAHRLAAYERGLDRSEEHTSELQSLMRISYAVLCLKKKKAKNQPNHTSTTQQPVHKPTTQIQ